VGQARVKEQGVAGRHGGERAPGFIEQTRVHGRSVVGGVEERHPGGCGRPADWDQADVADVQVATDDAKLYTNITCVGVEFTNTPTR
jgi:hypothetical protein